jgi:glycosyltransferase involved in cell wall biosynthesis
MKQAVVFLCTENEIDRERRGYFKAFSKRIATVCIPALEKDKSYEIDEILPDELEPLLLIHPDAYPRRLPHGLTDKDIPTACFTIDTYECIEDRIRFSMLFDYAFVFHPGFDRIFEKAGHPRAVCLPHAVEAEIFAGKEMKRIYEVGWVGRLDGKNYSVRRRCIEKLRQSFVTNEIDRHYNPQEMATIYKQSKIVVNLSRDDYLKDANLRCFEAMAAGALLITPKPTELSELGFVEGVHYIAYENESDIENLVRFYLDREGKRSAIAQAAKDLVMREYTYDRRAEFILNIVAQDNGKLFAPARHWDKAKVQALYVWYFAKSLAIETTLRELRHLRSLSRQMTLRMIPSVTKTFFIHLKMLF